MYEREHVVVPLWVKLRLQLAHVLLKAAAKLARHTDCRKNCLLYNVKDACGKIV